MKWIVLLSLFAIVPILTNWLNTNQNRAHYVWTMLGFLPFTIFAWHLLAAPISWAQWPGYVKGIEVTALDALALAILMSKSTARYKLPFKWPFFFYILAVAATIPLASVPIAATFYVWQLLRIFLYFMAIARVAATERGVVAILRGMVFGMAVTAGYSIVARLGGAIQTGGSLGHQNSLGLIAHMVMLPSFACILAGRHAKLGFAGVLLCIVAVILTASRASIGIGAAGFAVAYLLSVLRHPSGRKASMGLAFGVFLLVAFPFAQQALQRRFDSQAVAMAESGGYDERAAFVRAAKLIIKDHPFGVGSNLYVTTANLGGYSEKAGVIWNSGSRGANVHNVYLLMWAETGYFGLITFIFLLASAIWTAISTAWKFRDDVRGELLIGVGAGLTMTAMHNLYEWIFILYSAQYFFAISLGLVAGICYQMRSSARAADVKEASRPPLVRAPSLQPSRRGGSG